MSFFAIPNKTSHTAREVKPWEVEVTAPPSARKDKAAWEEWNERPTTKGCHYTAAEGLNPMSRVNKKNPTVRRHGIVVDYDAPSSLEMLHRAVTESPIEFPPNWGTLTFSNRARLVWEFTEPVAIASLALDAAFLKHIATRMKLDRFHAGFDENFYNPCQYYEKGHTWTRLSPDRIPANIIWHWLYEAGNKLTESKWPSEGMLIPIEEVAKEVERQYPRRWEGEFALNARGVRFWDPVADNASSAVVRPTGMQCFSGEKGFLTWREILGPAFVRAYEANTTGKIIQQYCYDGKHYWELNEAVNTWWSRKKEDVVHSLKTVHNRSTRAISGKNHSEIDLIIQQLWEQRSVVRASPLVHFPTGITHLNGERVLNTSTAACLDPSSENITEWGDRFPWLASFLDNLFFPHDTLQFFLSWWKHFYENGLIQKPRSGLMLYIAGDTNCGKTMLTNCIVAKSVGGSMPASDVLVGGSGFNSHALTAPLMTLDDASPASDPKKHAAYTSMVKAIVANPDLLYSRKFVDSGKTRWLGRIAATCNDDPESIRILPSMDDSIMDKIMLLKCNKRKFDFGDMSNYDIEEVVGRELPFMCRWLLNFRIPPHCKGESRFGVKPYKDQLMLDTARQNSNCFSFYELLVDFLLSYETDKDYWEGTTTRLISDMCADDRIETLASKYTPNQAASLLGQLKARGFELEKVRSSKQRIWRIPVDIAERRNGYDSPTE